MWLLGCDCNSKSIACTLLGSGEYIYTELLESTEKDTQVRFCELVDKFGVFLRDLEAVGTLPTIVYVELPIYMQNTKTTLSIAYVVGLVRVVCRQFNITCKMVDNKTWKRVVVGKGNATKEEIMQYVLVLHEDVKSQDIADSICIAYYGLREVRNED